MLLGVDGHSLHHGNNESYVDGSHRNRYPSREIYFGKMGPEGGRLGFWGFGNSCRIVSISASTAFLPRDNSELNLEDHPMGWNLRAQLIETCSCNMLCPCWFGVKDLMVMDRGWCDSALVFRILDGKSNGVDIGSRTVILAVDFPGPTLFDGGGTARIYVDNSADSAQRRELEAVFQGKQGGPMEVIAGLVKQWLPTQAAKVDVLEEGDTLTVSVENFGSVQSQLLKNEAGQIMTMQNVGFAAVLQFDELKAELAPSSSNWRDKDMPRQFETKSGARAAINWRVA
jgi:hypothetical protein